MKLGEWPPRDQWQWDLWLRGTWDRREEACAAASWLAFEHLSFRKNYPEDDKP